MTLVWYRPKMPLLGPAISFRGRRASLIILMHLSRRGDDWPNCLPGISDDIVCMHILPRLSTHALLCLGATHKSLLRMCDLFVTKIKLPRDASLRNLTRFTNLRVLDARGTVCVFWEDLAKLPKLKTLYLKYVPSATREAAQMTLPQLTKLKFDRRSYGESYLRLPRLPALKTLSLYGKHLEEICAQLQSYPGPTSDGALLLAQITTVYIKNSFHGQPILPVMSPRYRICTLDPVLNTINRMFPGITSVAVSREYCPAATLALDYLKFKPESLGDLMVEIPFPSVNLQHHRFRVADQSTQREHNFNYLWLERADVGK